jgi:hypothetical protein
LISQEVCHSNIFFKSQTPYHTNLWLNFGSISNSST